MDRAGSAAPRPLPLFRAALGTKTRRSHRQRTGNALRPDRLAAPPRVLWQNRPRRSPRNLYPQRVSGAGMRFESGLFCPQQKAD